MRRAQGVSHLSCEDEGLLATYLVFALVFGALVGTQVYAIRMLQDNGERVHPVRHHTCTQQGSPPHCTRPLLARW